MRDSPDIFTAYGSNAFRLTLRQWNFVAVVTVLFVVSLPFIWKRIETLNVGPDFRMNYELSNDYALYERVAAQAVSDHDTILIGDSVAWGQYVKRGQTLSHYLNELSGSERVANLGVDGMHPLALAGLVKNFAGSVSGKSVILLCNPLWMSSPKHDLQTTDEFRFNHPKLVPQFSPWIQCYKEDVNVRLGNAAERSSDFLSWNSHLQQTYFDKQNIPAWTIEHPYAAPWSPLTFEVPVDSNIYRHEPVPWTTRGIQKQDFPFVELKASIQWRAFKEIVETLSARSNRVCVMIVPLNEHMMSPESQKMYTARVAEMLNELRSAYPAINCFAPPVLPSEMYADASHPLADGYRSLAAQVFENVSRIRRKNSQECVPC